MTGIAAIFSTGAAPAVRLDPMLSAMSGRVYDARGVWASGPCGLGALVLHTTAESLEAGPPHTNEDESLALVMDGYLTNWEELRRDLLERGARLRNRSDAELVLRAYEQWGEDCANRIEGEFAFVIADQRARRIYAARDHQGLRPLFWYQDKDALLIASDMAAIIAAADHKPEPNLDYLACFVSGHWYQRDATVWRGIERVPQAHWLSFDGVQTAIRQYYDLPVEVTINYRREEDYVDHYREVLFDAVRRTARSHRPLGVTVSGGLDSSAIYCICHALEERGRLPAPGFQGYTLAGPEGADSYEVPYARAAAAHCGRPVIEVPLFRPGIDWFIDQSRRDCDVPVPKNAVMSLHLEQRAAQEGARTIVGGDGGDQWLDGNREYYREFARAFDLRAFMAALRRDAEADGWRAAVPPAIRFGLNAFVPSGLRKLVHAHRRRRQYLAPGALDWMQPQWRRWLLQCDADYFAALPDEARAMSKWDRLFSPYRAFALDNVQRQYSRTGVEGREPMQTRQFIEFCTTTPQWIRNQAGLTKVVHRKAMRGLMPDAIVDRLSKAEFSDETQTAAFARFASAHREKLTAQLCDERGTRQLTATSDGFRVDPERGWEVWGLCAVAAFLQAYEDKAHGALQS